MPTDDPGRLKRMDEFSSLPPKEAIVFFRNKGFLISYSWQDVSRETHDTAFTVAKATSIDVLEAIRGGVDQAIAEGTTAREFQQQLIPLLGQLGWWGEVESVDPDTGEKRMIQVDPRRLRTILDTNMRAAHTEGQWERTLDRAEIAPILIYDANNSQEPDETHSAWDGLAFRYDDPWVDRHRPIKRFGCKCRFNMLTERQARARGITVREGGDHTFVRDGEEIRRVPERFETFRNKRTGQTIQVPAGSNPAFLSNQQWGRRVEEYYDQKRDSRFFRFVEELPKPEAVDTRPIPTATIPRLPWRQDLPESPWHNAAFVNAPDAMKNLVARVGPLTSLEFKRGRSHQSGHTIVMDSAYQIDTPHAQGTWRHEFGHFIDLRLGPKSSYRSTDTDFSRAMDDDAKDMIHYSGLDKRRKKAMAQRQEGLMAAYDETAARVAREGDAFLETGFAAIGLNLADVRHAIEKHAVWEGFNDVELRLGRVLTAMTERDAQGLLYALEGRPPNGKVIDWSRALRGYNKGVLGKLSDLFSAATLKRVEGHGCHSRQYYKDRPGFGQQVECWANITALAAEGNPFWLKIIKRFTPRMWDVYREATGV